MIFVDTRLYGAPVFADPILENNTWKTISKISQKGEGANYWAVGDRKNVYVSGPVGRVQIDETLQVFIIGFDHNKDLEGAGITFQGFKNPSYEEYEDIVLWDDKYNPDIPTGKTFSMNHDVATIIGGWKDCDLRYDVLGSTDTQKGDASEETPIAPISNTLMAALPSDLRAVMKPLAVWSNNPVSADYDTVRYDPSSITQTIDYLPLLAAFEIAGETDDTDVATYINAEEMAKQAQYKYYVDGGSMVRYRHTGPTRADWWTRSVFAAFPNRGIFVGVANKVGGNNWPSNDICGISPIFRV